MALVARKIYPIAAERSNSLFDLHREIEQIFSNAFRGFDVAPFSATETEGMLAPRLDIAETQNEYQVSAELPGVDEKDLKVTLEKGVLTITGEKKSESEEKGKNWHRSERSYGSFHRAVSLPQDADPDKISASFKRGVLQVSVAKKPAPKSDARQIEVKFD